MIGDEFHDWIKDWRTYAELTEPFTNFEAESVAPPESEELPADDYYNDKSWQWHGQSWQSGEWVWSARRGWWWIDGDDGGEEEGSWGKWQDECENKEDEEQLSEWNWHTDDDNQPEEVKDSSEEEPALAGSNSKKNLPQLKGKSTGKEKRQHDDDGGWGGHAAEKKKQKVSWSMKTVKSQSTASASLASWSRR